MSNQTGRIGTSKESQSPESDFPPRPVLVPYLKRPHLLWASTTWLQDSHIGAKAVARLERGLRLRVKVACLAEPESCTRPTPSLADQQLSHLAKARA